MTSPAVVLVHGLYHQPVHLEFLADALRQRGTVVHVPYLHRGSLAADIGAVQHVIDDCADDPILVGHSYGGAVAAGVHRAARLVFVAAFVPDVGESCASLGGSDAPVNAVVRPHPEGGTYVPAGAAADLFYGDCSVEDTEWAVRLLVPQASGHGRGVLQAAPWKNTPRRYVICADDQAIRPDLQERMAARCTNYDVIRAAHSPYISQPETIADIILDTDHSRQTIV